MNSGSRRILRASAIVLIGGAAIYLGYRYWIYRRKKSSLKSDLSSKDDIPTLGKHASLTSTSEDESNTEKNKSPAKSTSQQEKVFKPSHRYRMKRNKKLKRINSAIHKSSGDDTSSSSRRSLDESVKNQ